MSPEDFVNSLPLVPFEEWAEGFEQECESRGSVKECNHCQVLSDNSARLAYTYKVACDRRKMLDLVKLLGRRPQRVQR